MINALLQFLFYRKPPTPVNLAAKDPLDMTLTESSREWSRGDRVCVVCKMQRSYSEHAAGICGGCGGSLSNFSAPRGIGDTWLYRQVWDGKRWVWQYITGNSFTWLPKAGWFTVEPRHDSKIPCEPSRDPDIWKETNYQK